MEEIIARALCKSEGTAQCAPICLSHFSTSTTDGKCPEADRVWSRKASAIAAALRTYAEESAAQSERAGLEREVSEAEVDAAARALYECESKRGEHGNSVLSQATGKSIKGLSVEPWEECAETFRADARTALSAARKAGGE